MQPHDRPAHARRPSTMAQPAIPSATTPSSHQAPPRVLRPARRTPPAPVTAGCCCMSRSYIPAKVLRFGKIYDLILLAMGGGCARSEEQLRVLPEGAGLRITRVMPTPMFPLTEAVPAL